MSNDRLEHEMFKLRTSFLHRKDQLLSRIRDKNDAVWRFLDKASNKIQLMPSPKQGSGATSFTEVQEHAQALYQCLQLQWFCTCTQNHPCGIKVQPSEGRKDDEKAYLQVLFDDNSCRTQLKVMVESPAIERPQTVERYRPDDISELAQKMSIKNRLKERFGLKGSKAVPLLAVSSVLTANNIHPADFALDEEPKKRRGKLSRLSIPGYSRERRSASPTSTIRSSTSRGSASEM